MLGSYSNLVPADCYGFLAHNVLSSPKLGVCAAYGNFLRCPPSAGTHPESDETTSIHIFEGHFASYVSAFCQAAVLIGFNYA